MMFNALRTRASMARTMVRGGNAAAQKRYLSIHEHLSMDILNKYGIATPKYIAAKTPDEAFKAAQSFGGKEIVIKAQVLAGGRGKGHFDSGLQGGVHLIKTPEEARDPRCQDARQQAHHQADRRRWPSLQRRHDRRGAPPTPRILRGRAQRPLHPAARPQQGGRAGHRQEARLHRRQAGGAGRRDVPEALPAL
ncbi:hypothetical protein L1887_48402 [Cichorium endivia]|nr:hypothetical protein L1887_48402 [Cichorium endivia]